MEQQRDYPGATGDFTGLLTQIALAAKVIAREVNKAGLVNILGFTGEKNVQGEQVTKLDVFAHQTLIEALEASGHVCAMASEEVAEPIMPASEYPRGPYVVLFDPLDGSSNIDINITIGTIFSIHRKVGYRSDNCKRSVAAGDSRWRAGYVVYGFEHHVRLHHRQPRCAGYTTRSESRRVSPVPRKYSHAETRRGTYSANEGNSMPGALGSDTMLTA
jgi:fructose-1,6-bisphosphatase I